MKKILKYTFVGLMGCSVLTSCLDSALDTAPTDSMSGTTLLSNANSALIPLMVFTVQCILPGHRQTIPIKVLVSIHTQLWLM